MHWFFNWKYSRVRGKNGTEMPGKNSGYHPGIPQSEPFTKWDTDKDEVEVDYKRMDGGRTGAWFSGPKGIFLKILLVIVIFSVGLIIGYVLRRSVHEIFHTGSKCAYTDGYEGYSEALSEEVQKFISADSLRQNIEDYTATVHLTSTHNNNLLGLKLKKQMSDFGLKVKESKYNVLLSYADWEKSNTIYLINETGSVVYQTMYRGPSEIYHPELTEPYNAYAPNGSIKGDLVYANFGEESDFMELEDKNVSCKGKIVIMRYGRIFRGTKVKNAEDRGAIGVILYSDPEQVTRPGQGVYPESIYLPDWAAQRGSVARSKQGDPLTPGIPSVDGVPRIDVKDAALPKIPVQPIGYLEAATLMENMAGPSSTDSFHGKLDSDVNYNLGPGYKTPDEKLQVKLEVNNQQYKLDITNFFGVIEGAEEPDRYIIVGCHYDAWTFGALDPNVGTGIMMEMIKALSRMVTNGWKPRRTIIFAHWDAEEQGLIGSYEWVEEHAKELSARTVAYLNLDGPIRGNNSMKVHASPLLRHLTFNASRLIPSPGDPDIPTLFELWKRSNPDPTDESLPQVLDSLSNSDTAPFQNLLGVPSFYPRFYKAGVDDIPAYHTPIDNFDYLIRLVDPHFLATEAMARFVTEMVLQLSSSTKIPFDARELAQSLEDEFNELRATLTLNGMKFLNKLDNLQWAVGNFSTAAGEFHQQFVDDDVSRVLDTRRFNDKVMQVSRAFIHPEGLPGQPTVKNILSAPNADGAPMTFTGIRTSFHVYEQSPSKAQWAVVEKQIAIAMLSVQSASRILSEDLFSRGAPPTGS